PFDFAQGWRKALVEIERVRGFLDAVKLKDDWIADMQKKALILESHHSTHIEGTVSSLRQANKGQIYCDILRHPAVTCNFLLIGCIRMPFNWLGVY
ncbi:MAG: hypothetical protein HY210_08570, partial [Candidatus Omnitrophica bacterium]|nr:hypothetical protein [Candidatus Omnitrophota bacterium]